VPNLNISWGTGIGGRVVVTLCDFWKNFTVASGGLKILLQKSIELLQRRFKNGHAMLPVSGDLMTDHERKATIHFAGNDLFVGISPSGHAQAIETDSHRNRAATPMELLLLAVGGCTGVDVISILKKKRQHVTDYRIEVHADRREEFPRAYTRIYVKHIVTGHRVSEQAVAMAIELSDQKYCSVGATVRGKAEIVTSYEIIEDTSAKAV
jgi:putative redox protein